ncbi:MAG: hydroxyacid dehydrogenase [Eubacteriales bacterium]|nr:hydroxyacid dehydrogenase [Eubacteriales bacterium]
MKIVMLDVKTLGDDIGFEELEKLGELVTYDSTAPDEVEGRIADCDVVVLNKIKLNSSNLTNAKNLKLICVTATGYDNIDVAYCAEHGIGVCNVVGYSTDSVAQLTVALALELVMRLPAYTDFVNSGAYTESGIANRLEPCFYELSGKVWGIVGMGNIGKKVAKVAEAFGCKVICTKRTYEEGLDVVELAELMQRSDVISVHLPLSDETKGVISKDMIALMKKDAVIVNVARGAVIDEKALAQAVEEGKIYAASDVYSVEPFGKDHPFYGIMGRDNFVLTPHMAWGAYEARKRVVTEVAQNIIASTNGEIRSRVDK